MTTEPEHLAVGCPHCDAADVIRGQLLTLRVTDLPGHRAQHRTQHQVGQRSTDLAVHHEDNRACPTVFSAVTAWQQLAEVALPAAAQTWDRLAGRWFVAAGTVLLAVLGLLTYAYLGTDAMPPSLALTFLVPAMLACVGFYCYGRAQAMTTVTNAMINHAYQLRGPGHPDWS